jgi:hypothetical protein
VSGQLHAPAALLPGKSPRYPFYRRLGWPQSQSGRYGEVKIFYHTGTRTPASTGRPARSQSLPTELSRLLLIAHKCDYNAQKKFTRLGVSRALVVIETCVNNSFKDYFLLLYDTVYSGRSLATFQINFLPQYSG